MNLSICSLASGSSGNSYLVRSDSTALLVDAGISAKQIKERLGELGLEICDISGILITHEHSDHIKGLGALLKNNRIKIFANKETLFKAGIDPLESDTFKFESGDSFAVGDITVTSFSVSHDADNPVGYYFEKNGCKISIVTDTGMVTDSVIKAMSHADILVLESNHDENVLKMGRYPWFLKQRILGPKGHLSNEAASEALSEVLKDEKLSGTLNPRMILLAHLSKENNFPEMAIMTMKNYLEEVGILLNREVTVEALPRSARSKSYFV